MLIGGSTQLPIATASQLGSLLVTGNIADAAVPTVRSADGFQVKALAATVGPISSQTTLQDVTGMSLTITSSATEQWLVRFWLLVVAASTTGDLALGFTAPTACSISWGGLPGSISALSGWGAVDTATTPVVLKSVSGSFTCGTFAGVIGVPIIALVRGGGTAGTVQLRYAQNVSNASNLSIRAGSFMEATRIAV